jgi:hypothetical protein
VRRVVNYPAVGGQGVEDLAGGLDPPERRVGESEQGCAAFQEYIADHWAGSHSKIEQAAMAVGPAQA